MKTRWFFSLLIPLLLLGLSHCIASQQDLPRPTQLAFKGMELYSWQDANGDWRFSLLLGTNRIKTQEEVLSDPLDLHEVKESFCRMAIGEQVLWSNWLIDPSAAGDAAFASPPRSLIDELRDQAALCQIELIFQ